MPLLCCSLLYIWIAGFQIRTADKNYGANSILLMSLFSVLSTSPRLSVVLLRCCRNGRQQDIKCSALAKITVSEDAVHPKCFTEAGVYMRLLWPFTRDCSSPVCEQSCCGYQRTSSPWRRWWESLEFDRGEVRHWWNWTEPLHILLERRHGTGGRSEEGFLFDIPVHMISLLAVVLEHTPSGDFGKL